MVAGERLAVDTEYLAYLSMSTVDVDDGYDGKTKEKRNEKETNRKQTEQTKPNFFFLNDRSLRRKVVAGNNDFGGGGGNASFVR